MELEFLTERTRKLRKSLLVASLIGFAISKAGLRVTKISLLGSELSITRFDVIPLVLGIVVLYFLVTFIVFGFYEYSQSYRKRRDDYLERLSKGTVYSRQQTKKTLELREAELESLQSVLIGSMLKDQDRIREKIGEIEQEISKLTRLLDFIRYYKGSIFERLRLRGLKTLFDLFVPTFIGLYVVILLFFFTKIPKLNDKTLKPTQDIISEKVNSNDTTQVIPDSLIKN